MSRSVSFAQDAMSTLAAAPAGTALNTTETSTTTALATETPASSATPAPTHPPPPPPTLLCPNCGGNQIDQHDASGASVCTFCGVVVEENAIVSAVEFVEGAGGASNMVGQFVSATSSKAYIGPPAKGGRYGFSRDSRETTLANGRRRIQEVASRLRLSSHYVDAAHRLFTIAVEKNFVQGRRTTHVVAACLYIACRQEKSQHMLIDFSDALQVNVYTLGTCFLKFRRLLGLKLEIIDPALYVYRFAAHLELDDKANAVALTALRLVGRMKRDWIVAGRRPAGICAAALLIAARAHGFEKHHNDVTRILRVCGWTVTSRVKEFEQTPSAQLTLEQFGSVQLEGEADPPVYTRNKIREARARAIQEGNVDLLTSGALDDQVGSKKRAKKWRSTQSSQRNEKKQRFETLYQSLAQELSKTQQPASTDPSATEVASAASASDTAEATTKATTSTTTMTTTSDEAQGKELVVHEGAQIVPKDWNAAYPRSKYGKALILPNHATEEERQASVAPVEAKLNLEEWKEGMPEGMDEELDTMFRTDEEVAQKEAIFNKINKDYLAQQERKEHERLSAEAATKDQEEKDTVQAQGHARYKSSRSRSKRRRSNEAVTAAEAPEGGEEVPTTEEQLLAAVSSRKISRKINYDALSSIFDEDGSFSTDILDDGAAANEESMYGSI